MWKLASRTHGQKGTGHGQTGAVGTVALRRAPTLDCKSRLCGRTGRGQGSLRFFGETDLGRRNDEHSRSVLGDQV